MRILAPTDLGLPAKFTRFLPDQLPTACAIHASPTRIQVLDAPTGRGKTFIYMTVAQLANCRTLILTGTRRLQDQAYKDFRSIGLVDVRGMGNYPCVALRPGGQYYNGGTNDDTSCADGPCLSGAPCSLKNTSQCHFYAAVASAKQSRLVSTNYAFYLTRHYILGEFDLIICDEAHSLIDWLTKSTTCTLSQIEIKQLLDMDIPLTENVATLKTWSSLVLDKCGKVLQQAEKALHWSMCKDITSLYSSLHRLAHARVDWMASIDDDTITVKPTTVGYFLEKALQSTAKVILSSATINDSDLDDLGLKKYHTHSLSSTFPTDRRPVVFLDSPPYISLNYRSTQEDYVSMASILANVCSTLRVKTVVHTVSYVLAARIYDLLPDKSRYLVDTRTCDQVDKYLTEPHPWILLTPKLREGVDLGGDLCRLNIILKLPYPNFGDKLIIARRKLNRHHTDNLTARAITQSAGRGMRYPGDWCITLIIDSNWKRWARPKYFAPWFGASIGTLEHIDQLTDLVP